MQRLGGTSPVASPIRPGYGKSSPLARVAEESALPELETNGLKQPTKLVEVETPRPSEDNGKGSRASLLAHVEPAEGEGKENQNPVSNTNGKANGKQAEVSEEPMKEIEI